MHEKWFLKNVHFNDRSFSKCRHYFWCQGNINSRELTHEHRFEKIFSVPKSTGNYKKKGVYARREEEWPFTFRKWQNLQKDTSVVQHSYLSWNKIFARLLHSFSQLCPISFPFLPSTQSHCSRGFISGSRNSPSDINSRCECWYRITRLCE